MNAMEFTLNKVRSTLAQAQVELKIAQELTLEVPSNDRELLLLAVELIEFATYDAGRLGQQRTDRFQNGGAAWVRNVSRHLDRKPWSSINSSKGEEA